MVKDWWIEEAQGAFRAWNHNFIHLSKPIELFNAQSESDANYRL